MIALSDLLVPASTEDMINTINSVLGSLGIPYASWRPNGPMSSLRRGVAMALSGVSSLVARATGSGFLDTAQFDPITGGWLALLAQSVYGVTWQGPNFASGPITLTNTGGGVFNVLPQTLLVQNPITGKQYRNVDAFALTSVGQVVTPTFEAIEAGSASTSATGAINAWVTSSTLTGVTVGNAAPLIGSDGQSASDLITACKNKLSSLSPNGPKDAYAFIALSDPTTIPILVKFGLTTQTSQPITRAIAVADPDTGIVNVYLATASGPPSDPDLAIVNTRIQAVCVPLCVRAFVQGAVPVVVPVTYEAWLKNSGLDTAGAESVFATALANYVASLPIGGYTIPPDSSGSLKVNTLEGVLFGATPGVLEAVVSGSDFVLDEYEVPVLGTITPTVNLL